MASSAQGIDKSEFQNDFNYKTALFHSVQHTGNDRIQQRAIHLPIQFREHSDLILCFNSASDALSRGSFRG